MPRFSQPTLERFFDNRLIIAWTINQPMKLSPLKNLLFRIYGDHPLEFIPHQEREIVIPELADGNEFLISWVVGIPTVKTEISLTVDHETFSEEYRLVLDPHRLPNPP